MFRKKQVETTKKASALTILSIFYVYHFMILLGRLINMNKLVEKSTREFLFFPSDGSLFAAVVNLHGII